MMENNEEKVVLEEKTGIKNYIDYLIIIVSLAIVEIILLATKHDMQYSRLVFGSICLSFGAMQLKVFITKKEKSLLNLTLGITWLLLALLQFVSFFIGLTLGEDPGVSSSLIS